VAYGPWEQVHAAILDRHLVAGAGQKSVDVVARGSVWDIVLRVTTAVVPPSSNTSFR
jgi:hypothetical protein